MHFSALFWLTKNTPQGQKKRQRSHPGMAQLRRDNGLATLCLLVLAVLLFLSEKSLVKELQEGSPNNKADCVAIA